MRQNRSQGCRDCRTQFPRLSLSQQRNLSRSQLRRAKPEWVSLVLLAIIYLSLIVASCRSPPMLLIFPAVQDSQAVLASLGTCPASQKAQVDWAEEAEIFPLSQSVQELLPPVEYFEAGQFAHVLVDTSANWPRPQ